MSLATPLEKLVELGTYSNPYRELVLSVLMAGAFEEGRLRGALEDAHGETSILCPYCLDACGPIVAALRTPTLEEGER